MKHLIPIAAVAVSLGLAGGFAGSASALEKAALAELVRARVAAGGDAWNNAGLIVMRGTDHVKGIDARWRAVVDSASGRTREARDFGLFETVEIWDGSNHWSKGRSGGVHPIDTLFARMTDVTDAWLAARGYLKADAAGARLESIGRRTDSTGAYLVIKATPAGGQPAELWFEGRHHFLARTVQQLPIAVRTVSYFDYRTVGGVGLPFKITKDEGDPANADNIRVEHVAFEHAATAEFERPHVPMDFTIAGNKAVVPMEFDGFVSVEAKLNGKGPFAFILDTAGRAILTHQVAQMLGLQRVGSGKMSGAGSGTRAFQYATVARMNIGGLFMRNIPFAVSPLDFDTVERGSKPPFAGILGLEMFERLAIRIDYRHQRLTFQPLTAFHHQGPGMAIPIKFESDAPLMDVKIDGLPGTVELDTGNPLALAVQGSWAKQHGLVARLRVFPLQAFGGMGGELTLWAGRSDVEIGGRKFPGIVSYYADTKSGSFSSRTEAGNLGNAVLANFTLEFDYGHGEVWLQLEPGFEQEPFDRSGLTVEKEKQEAFKVGSVAKTSPAAEAGLRVGDDITTVDGTPVAKLSGYEFGRMMRRAVGTRVVLQVVHDGKQRVVSLALRELLP